MSREFCGGEINVLLSIYPQIACSVDFSLFLWVITEAVMLSCLKFPSVYFRLRREPLGFVFLALTDPDMRRCEGCRGAAGAILRLPFGRNRAFFFRLLLFFFFIRSTWAEQRHTRPDKWEQHSHKSAHSKLPHFIKWSRERMWAETTRSSCGTTLLSVFYEPSFPGFCDFTLGKEAL